jgi:hypothetical protein
VGAEAPAFWKDGKEQRQQQKKKQVPYGNDKQEGQQQKKKQIPYGNDKTRRANTRTNADSLRE